MLVRSTGPEMNQAEAKKGDKVAATGEGSER